MHADIKGVLRFVEALKSERLASAQERGEVVARSAALARECEVTKRRLSELVRRRWRQILLYCVVSCPVVPCCAVLYPYSCALHMERVMTGGFLLEVM